MNWRTHIVGAMISFLLFTYLTGLDQWLIGLIFAGCFSILPDILEIMAGKHRSFGHSIFLVVPCLFIGFFNVTIAVAIAIGLISHTVLDLMTTNGTPIFTPLSKANFVILHRKRRIKTGTSQDVSTFITLTFLLIPLLCFNMGSWHVNGNSIGSVFGFDGLNQENVGGTNKNSCEIHNNININVKTDQETNTTIKVEKINENETYISVLTNKPPD